MTAVLVLVDITTNLPYLYCPDHGQRIDYTHDGPAPTVADLAAAEHEHAGVHLQEILKVNT